MRFTEGRIILSPSDLMRFQSCEHASALDLRYARSEDLKPAEGGDDAALLQKKGHAHEARYLDSFLPDEVVSIERTPDFLGAVARTLSAMRAGTRVIYQGALKMGVWQGWSDFLERVDIPSSLGPWASEVVDTKLKRRADPKHALQLSVYSRAVAQLQGHAPQNAHVVIGTNERVSIALEDVCFYADRLAERLELFVTNSWDTKPEPVSACGLCRWRDLCSAHYEAVDSLVRVAGITRTQRVKLERAGVTTARALASLAGRVPGMQVETTERLRTQARLQLQRLAGSGPSIEVKELETGRGFARLPPPSKGDLFFDMEGDPLVEGGLEYLFGVYAEERGDSQFRAWWAHTPEEERQATEVVINFFVTRLSSDPNAHIYHYNHYEVTALKRLTQRYGVGEVALDHLLRSKKFVDLYRVVQQGLICSEDGYSLKDLEVFYMGERDGAVSTAGDSIIAYETWLESRDQRILDDIERYNEVDCRSTKGLRDWLVSVRPKSAWLDSAPSTELEGVLVDPARETLKVRC